MNDTRTRNIVFYTPGTPAEAHPYRITAAGRNEVENTDPFVTKRYYQHTFILTLAGRGRIDMSGRIFDALPGTVSWLDTSQKYAHGCHPSHDNWQYLWFGMQGYRLGTLFARLDMAENPVLKNQAETREIFEETIANLTRQDRMTDAISVVHAARIIALFFEANTAKEAAMGEPEPIDHAIHIFRRDMAAPWDVDKLASSCNQSVSHFHRRFKEQMGVSPMRWIRQERINTAKYLLSVSDDRIASVGRRCGYPDPYHFSREFNRLTGITPSQFRRSGRP